MIRVYLLAAVLGASLFAAPSGEEVFKQRCAGCHEQNNPRIPRVEALHRMPAARILRTLNWGVMGNVAYTMTIAEREAVASYLGTHDAPVAAPPAAFCADRAVHFANDPKKPQPQWNGWSPSANNTRYQSAQAAGLTIDGVQHLKLKWAFAYDGDTTAFAQPTILDGNLFTGSAGGVIHALDAKTGCIRWTYDARGPVRSSILAVRSGKELLAAVRRSAWMVLFAGRDHGKRTVEEKGRRARRRAFDGFAGGVRRDGLRAGGFLGRKPGECRRLSVLHISRRRRRAARSRRRTGVAHVHGGCSQADRQAVGTFRAHPSGRRQRSISRAGCCMSPRATTIRRRPPRPATPCWRWI